jgi:hypothetical protein
MCDLSLNIDERRNVLSIFAGQVRQQPLEVEVHVALAGLGLQRVLVGHHELTESVQHLMEPTFRIGLQIFMNI